MSSIVLQSELQTTRRWLAQALSPEAGLRPDHFPVSFRYGEREAASTLEGWTMRRESARPAEGVSVETILLADPQTALECRVEVRTYTEFPAVDWVAYFRNAGTADTPILADILPLDVLLPVEPSAPCRVHHARGGLTQLDDFEPLATPLTFRQGGGKLELSARTGKSSTLNLPAA
jgi:hypothetical protein